MAKKSPQIRSLIILSATSQSSPRSAPRRTKKTYLFPIDSKRKTPLMVLHRGSPRGRLQAVVLRLQAHVSYLSPDLSLLSLILHYLPGSLCALSPFRSLCFLSQSPSALSLLISLFSLPISLCSLLRRENRERSRESREIGRGRERSRVKY